MIRDLAEKVVDYCGTRKPFDICSYLDINIILSDLGERIMGFYQRTEDKIIILHINNRLDEETRNYVCSHELGHAIAHPEMSISFFIENPLSVSNKYEIEADTFAAELLLEDDLSDTYSNAGYTIDQIAASEKVPPRLIELKYKNLNEELNK